jgi:hypothetical protein
VRRNQKPAPPPHATGIPGVLGRQALYLTQIGCILAVHGVVRLIAHYTKLEHESAVRVLEDGSLWFAVVQFFVFEGIEFIGAVRRSWRQTRGQ